MKKTLSIYSVFLTIGFLLGFLVLAIALRLEVSNSEDVDFHEHADFALFIDGEKFDFSDFRYMSNEPCKITSNSLFPSVYAHGGEATGGGLEAAVHLHNGKGGTIHVHKPGITYEDFFASIGMSFHDNAFVDADGNRYEKNSEKKFSFIINGKRVDSIESEQVRDLDRVLISYGDRNRTEESLIQEYGYVTNDACIASESCSHREPPEAESCAQEPTPLLLKMIGL